MSSNGVVLKKKLGIDARKDVKISRVINFPLKLYFVWYDSMTAVPVQSQRILKSYRPATLLQGLKLKQGGVVKHPRLTTPVPIELFGGVIQDAYFILVDLAGDWLPRGKKLLVKYENREESPILDLDGSESYRVSLEEKSPHRGFTVWNFANHAPSRRNKFFYQTRKEAGRSGSFLKEAFFRDNDPRIESGKCIVLKFRVNPTFGDGVSAHRTSVRRVKTMDLSSRVRWSSYYTVWVLFEHLEDDLTEEELDALRSGSTTERRPVIQKIFRTSTAKVHSNDMSFYWQGCWENAAQLGFSIFPFTGRHGSGVWSRKHTGEFPGIYITKHILEVMKVLPFNALTVAKILTVKEAQDETNYRSRKAPTGDAETADVG
jgi:hypothetical protein